MSLWKSNDDYEKMVGEEVLDEIVKNAGYRQGSV